MPTGMPESLDAPDHLPRRQYRFQFGLMAVLAVMVLAAILAAVIGAPLAKARHDRALKNNLKLLGLAFHNYHDMWKSFPPAYVIDADGKPKHSWRVLILPFLGPEAEMLAKQYDFDQPWDSSVNMAVARNMPDVFRSPFRRHNRPETDYMVIAGPGTLFEADRSTSLYQVTDGLSNTLLVVEVFDSGVPWTAPRDLNFEKMPRAVNSKASGSISKAGAGNPKAGAGNPKAGAGGIAGSEKGGAMVCFADGYVQRLPITLPAETLRLLILKSDGSLIDDSDFR